MNDELKWLWQQRVKSNWDPGPIAAVQETRLCGCPWCSPVGWLLLFLNWCWWGKTEQFSQYREESIKHHVIKHLLNFHSSRKSRIIFHGNLAQKTEGRARLRASWWILPDPINLSPQKMPKWKCVCLETKPTTGELCHSPLSQIITPFTNEPSTRLCLYFWKFHMYIECIVMIRKPPH